MAYPPPHLPLEGGGSFLPLQGEGKGGVKQMSVQLAWPD